MNRGNIEKGVDLVVKNHEKETVRTDSSDSRGFPYASLAVVAGFLLLLVVNFQSATITGYAVAEPPSENAVLSSIVVLLLVILALMLITQHKKIGDIIAREKLDSKRIKAYALSYRKKGYSDSQIKKQLKNYFPEKKINHVIRKLPLVVLVLFGLSIFWLLNSDITGYFVYKASEYAEASSSFELMLMVIIGVLSATLYYQITSKKN